MLRWMHVLAAGYSNDMIWSLQAGRASNLVAKDLKLVLTSSTLPFPVRVGSAFQCVLQVLPSERVVQRWHGRKLGAASRIRVIRLCSNACNRLKRLLRFVSFRLEAKCTTTQSTIEFWQQKCPKNQFLATIPPQLLFAPCCFTLELFCFQSSSIWIKTQAAVARSLETPLATGAKQPITSGRYRMAPMFLRAKSMEMWTTWQGILEVFASWAFAIRLEGQQMLGMKWRFFSATKAFIWSIQTPWWLLHCILLHSQECVHGQCLCQEGHCGTTTGVCSLTVWIWKHKSWQERRPIHSS